jgi:acyl carrier protein
VETTLLDREELRRTVADIIDVPVDELTDDVQFVADLGVDSLIALEVVVRLERAYGVKLDESKLAEITCMAAVYDIMLTKLAQR